MVRQVYACGLTSQRRFPLSVLLPNSQTGESIEYKAIRQGGAVLEAIPS